MTEKNPYAPPRSRVEEVSTQSVLPSGAFWVRFYLSPVGRTSRLHYWLFGLLPLTLMAFAAGFFIPRTRAGIYYHIAFGLLIFWPYIVILARRLHDLNLMGWWAAIYWLIPVGVVFMETSLQLPRAAGSNLNFIAAMVLGLFPGTAGPNRYGSDPLGRKSDEATAPIGE